MNIGATSITPTITTSSESILFTTTTVSQQFTTAITQAPRPTNEPTPMPSSIATVTGINGEQTTAPLPTADIIDATDPGDINDITSTTGSLLIVGISDVSNSNLGELVAGAIVAILAVLVLATLLVITIVFIFKRRRIVGKRMSVISSRVGFSNQNYERLGLFILYH